ncbi:hypothetical protein [Streptomyces sp. NPDC050600]|uniref:hypothetical protein n=1 Tax=Streptomyces sp. NPDC050600 TaxID=3157213 RepID=UPI003448D50F
MIASYGADLAEEHSRWIRDAIQTYGSRIGLALHAGSKTAGALASEAASGTCCDKAAFDAVAGVGVGEVEPPGEVPERSPPRGAAGLAVPWRHGD